MKGYRTPSWFRMKAITKKKQSALPRSEPKAPTARKTGKK